MKHMKRADRNSIVGNATINDFSFDKLKRDKENFDERLELVEGLLKDNTYFEEMMEISMDKYDCKKGYLQEDYEYATRLEALATYLLFAKDIEKGAELEHNIYQGNQIDNKHRKISSLDSEVEISNNGEDIKVEPLKKNYKKEKKRTFKNTDLKEMCQKHPYLIEYIKFLEKAKEHNNICRDKEKIALDKIKDDILYVCDKETIRFKMPLSDGKSELNLDDVDYSNVDLIRMLLPMEEKECYDFDNNLDVILYDFNNMIKKIKLTDIQKKTVDNLKKGYSVSEIARKDNVESQAINMRINGIVNKISKYAYISTC